MKRLQKWYNFEGFRSIAIRFVRQWFVHKELETIGIGNPPDSGHLGLRIRMY